MAFDEMNPATPGSDDTGAPAGDEVKDALSDKDLADVQGGLASPIPYEPLHGMDQS